MMLLFSLLTSAAAGLSDQAYERTIDLVEGLYLRPEEVDANTMLRNAADSLSDDLEWLIVENQGQAVNLRHGNGAQIGSVRVASLSTLPAALATLEDLVRNAGYDLGDVDLRLSVLRGVTRALDRYSRVLSGERLNRFDVRLKGTLVGIGITLTIREDQLVITRVSEGGPAALGGVHVGDVLLRIDGRSTINMPTSEATRRIRGEEGSTVTFTVNREGHTLELPLVRAKVIVPNVESRVLEGNVGYLAISHISQRTVENLLAELKNLREQGAVENGLVIDLRGNTGGSMKESARAVDLFVDEGLLLRTVGHDGRKVRNLQAQMDATAGGAIPPVPVAILTDERTASGAEIIAGALFELKRAALIGTRSYGKGTVQKIYPLDEDARLKLTVAQYLLANDRVIADQGIVPDVVVGEIHLNRYGVQYRGWDVERVRTPRSEILPWIRESWSYREKEVEGVDLVEDLARKAVLATTGPAREDLINSLEQQSAIARIEQESHLREALAAQGIDWSPATEPVRTPPSVDVAVHAEPDPELDDVIVITGTVENLGSTPIHRAMLSLQSEFSIWDNLTLPIGRVEPSAKMEGVVRVWLHAGVNPREDNVKIQLSTDGRKPRDVGSTALSARSLPKPTVTGTMALQGKGTQRQAKITLTNHSTVPIEGLEVHFRYPGEVDVELLDHAARTPRVEPGETTSMELQVVVGPHAPDLLPLRLVVETGRYGKLARWPVALPLNGSTITLSPPSVTALAHPKHHIVDTFSFPLRVTDDSMIDHVVVYHNGEKISWAGGGKKTVEFRPKIRLTEGTNRVLIIAEDNDGLTAQQQFVIRGIAADATALAPE